MFQSYDDVSEAEKSAGRLKTLRQAIKSADCDGFIVPRSDEHQGEYVPACAERLAWLTGFTGSAGTAVVLASRAAVFVDGRYTLQARDQLDGGCFDTVFIGDATPSNWLKEYAPQNGKIAYDPWLMTRSQVNRMTRALESRQIALEPVDHNLIDRVWSDRPEPPLSAVQRQPVAFTGRSSADKIKQMQAALADQPPGKSADAVVLTDPASIAWVWNIRGSDVPHTPLALAFAILHRDSPPALFIDGRKLSNEVRAALDDLGEVREPAEFASALEDLGKAGRQVLFDPTIAAAAIAQIVENAGGTIVEGDDPAQGLKAAKTPAELAGSRAAHTRDGAAMVKFLHWLDINGPSGTLTEIAVARQLETFRTEAGNRDAMPLKDVSFDTISGSGPNAAIVHYRVTESTDRTWAAGELLLVDSGAQYRDGTTDITRTVLAGEANTPDAALYRDRFTRVLKGHIALAQARFPKGTTGAQLDVLARAALWSAGLDYDHGTGHGVGAFLSVHEGPQRIAKTGHAELEPGMIISNEPGYYAEGHFGIRIENLVAVREAEPVPGGNRDMLSFETLSFVPIARNLIATGLLTAVEIAWLDLYHARVYATHSGWPDLTPHERNWLAAACRPLVG